MSARSRKRKPTRTRRLARRASAESDAAQASADPSAPANKAKHEPEQNAAAPGCRLRNFSKLAAAWLDRLAASRSETSRRLFCADMSAWRARLTEELAAQGMSLASLPVAEQRFFARALLWCEAPYLDAIPRAAEAFETALAQALPPDLRGRAIICYLPLDGCLWRVQLRSGRAHIAIADTFLLDASGAVPSLLAQFLGGNLSAGGRRRAEAANDQRALKQWIHTDKVSAYLQAIERHIACPGRDARGRVYDLAALYAENNEKYFYGGLRQPELRWSRREARCRTGYYDPLSNCITISSALDAARVPQYVVCFVLYHEMLHQAARSSLLGERGRIHDKTFRNAERKFECYEEAEAYGHALAQKKLR